MGIGTPGARAGVNRLERPAMMRSRARQVAQFLDSLPNDQRAIVGALRPVVRRMAPNTVESVVWNALSYHRPSVGGRVKGSVCLVEARDEYVALGFIHGASLPDPFGILRGAGKAKRWVAIESPAAARSRQVASLIRAAARHTPGR